MESRLASAAFVLVVAAYLLLGGIGVTDRDNPEPRDAAYNLLARGLMSGHLYLAKEAPQVLTQLKDPFDPVANKTARDDPRYRLHDLSYHNGRLYLYFGVAPALFVFIPWHLLTGGWLPHWAAVVLLCSAGLMANISLFRAVRSRCFPGSPPWMTAISVLILGLGSYAPLLAARADMWEIPIAFSYLSVSIALRCLWQAFVSPERAAKYIACASGAIGAAFLARPTALPNAAILLLPFASREVRRSAAAWAGAVLPMGLCCVAAGLYNALRFGGPFDFGQSSQLAGVYVSRLHTFSASYLLTNLRLYLFQGVEWSSVFPFTHEPALGPLRERLPLGHGGAEHISGALLNGPILWAALAVPAFICMRRPDRSLSLISISAAWLALSSLLLMSFFFGACSRYQFEFVPEMAFLASLGVLALETFPMGRMRRIARGVWIPALLLSSAFPVLYAIDRCASDHNDLGVECLIRGYVPGAKHEIQTAEFLSPGNRLSRLLSGVILSAGGRTSEAQKHFEALVRDFPDYAMAHFWLATVLDDERRWDEAMVHYRIACRLAPDDEVIREGLARALSRAR